MRRRALRPRPMLFEACLLGALTGCDPTAPPPSDAGPSPDGAEPGAATVELRFELDEDESSLEWELESARAWIAEVRADNDRGSDLEPLWDPDDPVTFTEGVRLSAAPATYGGASVRSRDGPSPTLELVYRTPDARVVIVHRRAFTAAMRCEGGGIGLRPADEIRLAVRFDASAIAERLQTVELPEPMDGEILVDDATAPEAAAALEAGLGDAWGVECEGGSG